MRLPDEVLKSVVFLGKKKGSEIQYGGTGFLVCVTQVEAGRTFQFGYLVTANHVARQIGGDVFYIRVNQREGQAATDVPLNWEKGNEVIWYKHPTDIHADVAVTPVQLQKGHDILMLPAEDVILNEPKRIELGIGIGDEVFIVGLFSHLKGRARSIPIVRVGNIAMFPDERVKVKTPSQETLEVEGFLVEARSIKAVSGSPVFARQTTQLHGFLKWGTNIPQPIGATAATLYLIGVLCAHWDFDPGEIVEAEPTKGVNVGVAVVIPAQKLIDILYGPELADMRRKIIDQAEGKNAQKAFQRGGISSFGKEFEQPQS